MLLLAVSQGGWLEKHAPDSVDSLAMHKKKVDEIRGWLELQTQPGLQCQAPRMLILSGMHCWASIISLPDCLCIICTDIIQPCRQERPSSLLQQFLVQVLHQLAGHAALQGLLDAGSQQRCRPWPRSWALCSASGSLLCRRSGTSTDTRYQSQCQNERLFVPKMRSFHVDCLL